MDTFLETVAQHIIDNYGNDLSSVAIVMPNKRASLFLNQYLQKAFSSTSWTPAYYTISELVEEYSSLTKADDILLVCELYNSYIQQTGKSDETLDSFYGWGQILLSDFDDLDKSMADAKQVFSNIKDIQEMESVDYLDESQKKALIGFFNEFSPSQEDKLKKSFIEFWSRLFDIYEHFNQSLKAKRLAYEGAMYRVVAEKMKSGSFSARYDHYLFVGFNILQKAEMTIFKAFKDKGKAHFYWDYDEGYPITSPISDYLKVYPNELKGHSELYNAFKQQKNITFISAPTRNIQGRYVTKWLSETPSRIADGERTAVVLCDESLLQTVVNSMPSTVTDANITLGYPLQQTPVVAFIRHLFTLQTTGRRKDDSYYLRDVKKVLRHPLASCISSQAEELLRNLTDNRIYYPSPTQLYTVNQKEDEHLKLLFTDVKSCPTPDKDAGAEYHPSTAMLSYLSGVMEMVAEGSGHDTTPLIRESVYRTYSLLNRLYGLSCQNLLSINLTTLESLIRQVIASTSVPFHGEPLMGMQVMGVLETRNLDFDHLLILSCNEGNMPKGVDTISFIPHLIRRAYQLTTIDQRVDIYAHYFFQMLHRATDVTITFSTGTNEGKGQEMSRYMLLLMAESCHNITRKSFSATLNPYRLTSEQVVKSEAVMDALKKKTRLSPSAINRYLRCQLLFYFNDVLGLSESNDDDTDDINNQDFGTIFHKAAQYIYENYKGKEITQSIIKGITESDIENAVDRAVGDTLYQSNTGTPTMPKNWRGVNLITRNAIVLFIKKLLRVDEAHTPFKILLLEEDRGKDIIINSPWGQHTIHLHGEIDRLDMLNIDGKSTVRVIDYKTGNFEIKPLPGIGDVFDPACIDKHSDYFLQSMFYAYIMRENPLPDMKDTRVAPALMFIQKAKAEEDFLLSFKEGKIQDIDNYKDEFMEGLKKVIEDIFNSDSFQPTDQKTRCDYCVYKEMCMNVSK